jgi:hypothetical protein
MYPLGHAQCGAPWFTVHVATGSHPAVAQRFVHSVPSPWVSAVVGGHVHVNPPPLLAQTATGSQLSDPSEHSSMSVQVIPLPR